MEFHLHFAGVGVLLNYSPNDSKKKTLRSSEYIIIIYWLIFLLQAEDIIDVYYLKFFHII